MARGQRRPDETPPKRASVASSSDGVGELAHALVDLVVFVPLGFVKRARTLLPELASEGRSTAKSAQVIGKFVLPVLKKQGRRAVDRTLSDLGQRPKSTKRPGSAAGSGVGESTVNVAAPPAPADAARPSSASAPAGGEPFPGYDHLGSAAVIARLGELDRGERGRVWAYEMLHRNRRTILGRLDQLDQPGEPSKHGQPKAVS